MDNLPIFHGGKLIGRLRDVPEPDSANLVLASTKRAPLKFTVSGDVPPPSIVVTSVTVTLGRVMGATIGFVDDPAAMLNVKGYEPLHGGLFVDQTGESYGSPVERVARAMCRQCLHGNEPSFWGEYKHILEERIDQEWSDRFGRLAYIAVMTMEGSKRDDRG